MKTFRQKKQLGFTLMELMIVVIIIGVLSATALPAYKNYVKKSEVASALLTIKSLVTPAELWFQEKGTLSSSNESQFLDQVGIDSESTTLGEINIPDDNTLSFTFSDQSSVSSTSKITYRRGDTGWECSVNDESIATKNCPTSSGTSTASGSTET